MNNNISDFIIPPIKLDFIIVFELSVACKVDIIGPSIYVKRNIGAAHIK